MTLPFRTSASLLYPFMFVLKSGTLDDVIISQWRIILFYFCPAIPLQQNLLGWDLSFFSEPVNDLPLWKAVMSVTIILQITWISDVKEYMQGGHRFQVLVQQPSWGEQILTWFQNHVHLEFPRLKVVKSWRFWTRSFGSSYKVDLWKINLPKKNKNKKLTRTTGFKHCGDLGVVQIRSVSL